MKDAKGHGSAAHQAGVESIGNRLFTATSPGLVRFLVAAKATAQASATRAAKPGLFTRLAQKLRGRVT